MVERDQRAARPASSGFAPARATRSPLLWYAVIGAGGVAIDYCLFLLLFNITGVHEQIANAISTTAGITHNFALNTLFNFRKTDRVLLRFSRFYLVGLTGIGLTFVLLRTLSGMAGFDPNLVKAGSLPLVLLLQYTINKRWSFA